MRTFPTIKHLHDGYLNGLSALDVIDGIYAQIEEINDPGIFITLLDQHIVIESVKGLGEFDPDAKPLWGIPFVVKDNIDVAGVPTTAACPEFAYTPRHHAFAVQKLIDAGAIVIGKTNLDQFATGLVGMRSPYPIPKNPIHPDYVPGGSSSGSGVSVGHGLVTFALGTDTAGSGRVPAGLNNIVGLKPTLGSISSSGMVLACQTLDTISIFAGTVEDAETVHQVISVYNEEDPWSKSFSNLARPMALPPHVRMGVPDDESCVFGEDANAEHVFFMNLDAMTDIPLQPISLSPFFNVAELLYHGPWVAERYQSIRKVIEKNPDILHPITRQIIEDATKFSAADAFSGMYQLAKLRRITEKIWQSIDVLIVPTFPRPRTVADLQADPVAPNDELGTYTNFVNLLDLCALSVPGKTRSDGLPSSITLIAPREKDSLLAALGKQLHMKAGCTIGATQTPVPEIKPLTTKIGDDEIEIVVVGAHLSGMTLNHELTSRHARFLYSGTTTNDYKLYSLAGGPPMRPGLMRGEPGSGHEIQIEVWAMPTASFASFVAGIPAPLGIGTVYLSDGTTSKGFIMEAEGSKGAEDISHFGGWRHYIASLNQ